MEEQVMMNKLDGVSENLIERMRRSRAMRDASLNANPMPVKSILKQSIQSPNSNESKVGRKVSMNPSTMVWEVETDYASPIKPFFKCDASSLPNTCAIENDVATKMSMASDEAGENGVKSSFTSGNVDSMHTCVNEPIASYGNKGSVGSNATSDSEPGPNMSQSVPVQEGDLGRVANKSFASVMGAQSVRQVVTISELRNEEVVEGATVALPLAAVDAVNARFANTLYGYFIGKRLAFKLVENYVNNTWAKFGLKRMQLHGEFFLFQFDTKAGMERVLETGPWLIRRVPLILNMWSPNVDLKKDEVKTAPVWIKLHHVPIVAYTEVGLSLITTQIGKPIMLDSYTSNMCVSSWGRSSYARALIEVSADKELMESIVIAIPLGKDKGHSLATVVIEYEWRPPRCSTCLIFDHGNDKCPKSPKEVLSAVVNDVSKDAPKHSNGTADDGFEVVKKKRNRKKKHQKQVDGVVLSKPSLHLHYRRVDKGNSTKQSGSNVASTSMVGKSTFSSAHVSNVRVENAFSVLNDDEGSEWNDTTTWQHTQQALNVLNESDSDVDEEITLDDRGGNLKTT
ncbi:zinc knuckle CX2CX4HX4C containing protein [Tanacetum coccineum]